MRGTFAQLNLLINVPVILSYFQLGINVVSATYVNDFLQNIMNEKYK